MDRRSFLTSVAGCVAWPRTSADCSYDSIIVGWIASPLSVCDPLEPNVLG